MKKLTVLFIALLYTTISFAQNTFKAIVKDGKTKEPLIGATALMPATGKGAAADTGGMITLSGIPDGKQVIRYSFYRLSNPNRYSYFSAKPIGPFVCFFTT
jgi:outer membrane receptor for ferrienterochelin and colicins